MKKIFATFCAALLTVVTMSAQTENAVINNANGFTVTVAGLDLSFNNDGYVYKHKISNVEISNGSKDNYDYKSHMGTIEIGANILSSPSYGQYAAGSRDFLYTVPMKSTQVSLNFLTLGIALNNAKTIGFTTALGLRCDNYRLEDATTFKKENHMIMPQAITEAYKKSKFTTTTLYIPVMFEFGQQNRLFASLGLWGGVTLDSHTKIKYANGQGKEKLHNIYVNPFRAGASVHFGYGRVYAYMNYEITELFQNGRGPHTNPYTVGIGLGF